MNIFELSWTICINCLVLVYLIFIIKFSIWYYESKNRALSASCNRACYCGGGLKSASIPHSCAPEDCALGPMPNFAKAFQIAFRTFLCSLGSIGLLGAVSLSSSALRMESRMFRKLGLVCE